MTIWDVYTVLVDNLGAMFHFPPTVSAAGKTARFYMDGAAAKCVTAATLKRWMKKAGIEAECIRLRAFPTSNRYEYIVNIH